MLVCEDESKSVYCILGADSASTRPGPGDSRGYRPYFHPRAFQTVDYLLLQPLRTYANDAHIVSSRQVNSDRII